MTRDVKVPPPRTGRHWLRRLLKLALIVVLAPFVLTLLYRFVAPPTSTLMLGKMLSGQSVDQRWVPMNRIAPELVYAVASAEDGRICAHNGVDWDVLQGLVKDALADDSDPVRGGSTIAMQTAKNLFLWPQRSYIRKALEIPLSLWIDLVWSKQRVMEVYLNIAEWGPGIFGAEAAAQQYFSRAAAELSRGQAILLAASLPNPHLFNPGKPGPKLRRRARRLSKRTPANPVFLSCLR